MTTLTLPAGNDTLDMSSFGLAGFVNGSSNAVSLSGVSVVGGSGMNTLNFATNLADPFYQIAVADTGVVTMTTASGSATFSNFQKVQFADVTYDLGSKGNDSIVSTSATGDVLYGLAGNDTLKGGAGADTMYGGSGNDYLLAGKGASQLYGGAGNDTLVSGIGADVMSGGTGHDVFVISAHSTKDVITDFTVSGVNSDKLNLHASGLHVTSLAQLLTHATQSGANTVINIGGHNTVTLDHVTLHTLTASDFIF